VVNFTPVIQSPEITALAASQIAKTSARLNSLIGSDGGEACEVRFGYGTTSKLAADFATYDTVTNWAVGFVSSQQPYVDPVGLIADTTYFYRVQIKNSDSTVTSTSEITFDTLDAISVTTNFKGIPTATTVNLSWIKGVGASQALIRYSFVGYPATVADGIQLYFSTGSSTIHTGLLTGTVVYYTIWGESGGLYSNGVNLLVTTLAGTGVTPDDTILMPVNWFLDTDYTTMSGFEPIFGTINSIADSLKMPRNTVWMGAALLVSMFFGFMALAYSRGKILYATIALLGTMGISSAMQLLPLYMIFLVIVMILGYGLSRRAF
jgi:hypothetical protein